jgi:hypothetical protein
MHLCCNFSFTNRLMKNSTPALSHCSMWLFQYLQSEVINALRAGKVAVQVGGTLPAQGQ